MGKLQERVANELILYVRQLAWLHATPKPPEGSRRAQMKLEPPVSRIEQHKRNGVTPQMPPNPMPHIIDRLVEIGLSEAAGMGSVAIGWQTIRAWMELTGIPLVPWEARLLRRLSIAYVAQGREADSENCPPPWRGTVSEQEQRAEVEGLKLLFGIG